MLLDNAIIKESTDKDVSLFPEGAPIFNPEFGGQAGYMMRIGREVDGVIYEEWLNSTPYISTNLIPFVMEYPDFLSFLPEPDKWKKIYKNLWETHPMTITGFNSGLSVEVDETPFGRSEMFQMFTAVKRARTTVSTTYKERANKAFVKIFDVLIRYGMSDPDVLKPLVANLLTQDDLDKINIYSPFFFTGMVLFVEPDILRRKAVDSWLTFNLFPMGNGDRTGQFQINAAGEGKELSIEWAGITLPHEHISDLAQAMLDTLGGADGVHNSRPDDMTRPVTGRSPDVLAHADKTGYGAPYTSKPIVAEGQQAT